MTAKPEEKALEPEKVNQPDNAPIAPDASTVAAATDAETLSHQWQKDSPALSQNATLAQGNPVNVIDQINQAQEDADKKVIKVKRPVLTEAEFERRTKLDVSNPDYINPSLDHFNVK